MIKILLGIGLGIWIVIQYPEEIQDLIQKLFN